MQTVANVFFNNRISLQTNNKSLSIFVDQKSNKFNFSFLYTA